MNPNNKAFKKYMNNSIKRAADVAVKKYSKEALRHNKDLKKFFSKELKIVAEIAASKPSEGHVKVIVQEEIKPIRSDINLIKQEIALINSKIN